MLLLFCWEVTRRATVFLISLVAEVVSRKFILWSLAGGKTPTTGPFQLKRLLLDAEQWRQYLVKRDSRRTSWRNLDREHRALKSTCPVQHILTSALIPSVLDTLRQIPGGSCSRKTWRQEGLSRRIPKSRHHKWVLSRSEDLYILVLHLPETPAKWVVIFSPHFATAAALPH